MLGIDAGSYALKFCLSEKRGESFAILRVGELVLVREENLPKRMTTLQENLRLFLQRNRLPKEAVLSFSHPQIVFQRINLPEMSQEELGNALQWEAHSLIPGEESFQVGWSILEKNGEKMDVLFSAVPSPVIEEFVETFDQTGIWIEAVEPHPISLMRGFLSLHPELFEASFTLVDIGFEKTVVICFGNRNVFLSRHLSWGMKRVQGVLQEKFRLSLPEAIEVVKRGENREGFPNQLEEAVLSISQDLVLELKRSFTFFQTEFGPRVLEKIFFSGGGALCQPLRSYISQSLSISPENTSPLVLRKRESLPSERFLAAVGASLWK